MREKIDQFSTLLLEENEKQNLISRKSGKEELEKHITDSLAVIDFIDMQGKSLFDIGSGAGFPGMILAIASPNTSVTLLESDLKKSSFLQNTAESMQLDHVNVIRMRAEEAGQDPAYREQFDFCSSRAVASINIMLEYGLPLLKEGGQMLLWKGKNYQQEIDEAQRALEVLGGEVENVFFYNLLEERDRVIVVVSKKKKTDQKYPRRTGVPAKRPL